MKSRSTLASIAALTVIAVGGCKVGPNYKAPTVPMPPAYSDGGHNGAWAAARPADEADRGSWWLVYGDAELSDLEQRCAKSNQSIEAALHAYDQAHDVVRENRASLFPTVSIGGVATRNRISNTTPLRPAGAAADYWEFLIPLNISWEPDFWGGVRRQIESSAANAQTSAANLASTRLSLQGMLAVTYFQLRGLDLQAQLLRSTIDAYTQAVKLTQARMKGGVASEIDVDEAQTQLEDARAQLIDIGVERSQYEHALAVLVGEPATGFHIDERALTGNPPPIPTGLPSQLLERRPDIAAAERAVAATNALIGVAKAAYYPNITLGASGGIESDKFSQVFNAGSAQWSAGPNASEVLFDAGRRKAQVDYALAQQAQATALYREQVLAAIRDVEDQLSALRVLEQETATQQRIVDAAKRSTALSQLRYKGGLATYLEVLTNQTTELTAERATASLATRRIVASAQLQMALGGGWSTAQLPSN
jgi:NodT family efflux transporter outer membrane factor (OMF) lipoprotein